MNEESPPRRILVIANPAAGGRSGLLAATLGCLNDLGWDVALTQTSGPGGATISARVAAQGKGAFEKVIAAGGDGTVNEVIAGLAGSDMPLGIIPLGTANVLANEIELSSRPEEIASLITAGTPRPIHLGVVGGRYFAAMAGVGFDAHVVRGVNLALKRWTGKFAYVWASLVQLARGTPLRYRVTIGTETYEAAQVIVANGHFYGGRFVCAPDASLDVPELHVVLFERPGRVNALRYLAAVVMGRVSRLEDVRVVPATTLTIDGPAGDPVQADGDLVATLPAEFAVAKETVALIRPD